MTSITPPQGFRHTQPIQVRWGDMDALGHVNNATFLTYLEQARINYVREIQLWQGDGDGIGLIMARCVIDYKLPLFAGDDVYVFTRCARLGNRSFDTAQWIMRLKDEQLELAAQATVTGVVYDYRAGKSTLMPDEWRAKIKAYEPTPPEE